jgi:quinol-cytochrome oxidoreductase complex cytochrome b subunit/cytochrome c2
MGLRSWLDDRTGYRTLVRHALDEPVVGGARWAYVFGSALAFLFVLQAVTGVLMALYYSPSTREAWGSVEYLDRTVTMGWLVRGLHHFGSSAIVILLVAHLFQVFLYGANRPPRELSWWTGVALLFVALAFSLTGYLLPWDQKGYWATNVVTSIAGTFPWFGRWLQHLVQGGNALGNLTLTRFFGFHVFFLPAALGLLVAAHVFLFRRFGVTPWPSRSPEELEPRTEPFWPRQLTYDLAASAAIFAVVLGVVLYHHGAPLDAPADPSSHYIARPDWYFLWLFELLKIVPGRWEGAFVLGFVVVVIVFLGALPLVDRRGPSLRHRWPHFVVGGLLAATVLTLTLEPMVRDARDPAVRAQEQQQKRAAARAFAVAGKGIPPGGAGELYSNDPRARGEHLFARHCQSCHKAQSGEGGDSGPDLRGYMTFAWVRGVIADPNQPRYFGKTALVGQMPPTPGSPEELAALASYVLSLGETSADPRPGRSLFDEKGCHACHARAGEAPRVGPSLRGYGSRAWIAGAIRRPQDPAYYGARSRMPPFASTLTGDELDDVVTFLLPDDDERKRRWGEDEPGVHH